MLAIRMQRTGRKGHAQFRIIVQESHLSPKSGRVVLNLGNYDPHAKTVSLDKDKAAYYLEHGAQPSSRAAVLLKNEGVKLPKWVKIDESKTGSIKNTEKLRKNRPAEEVEPEASAEVAPEEATTDESPVEAPAADAEAPAEETKEA